MKKITKTARLSQHITFETNEGYLVEKNVTFLLGLHLVKSPKNRNKNLKYAKT